MSYERDASSRIAHEVALLVRQAESARRSIETLDRSAYLLLDAIEASDPPTMHYLAERLQLDLSTVSRQAAALEAKGLVARCSDPADGRVSVLSLTLEGVSALNSSRQSRRAVYAALLSDWTDADRESLAVLLSRLNQAITHWTQRADPDPLTSGER